MSKISSTELSIVIPAFSEERRIGNSLNLLAKYLKGSQLYKTIKLEVIVVVPETTDRTLEIVENMEGLFTNLRIILPGQSSGKGGDLRAGMLAAKGKYVIFMDADLATPLWHIEEFYKLMLKGSEIVVGIRDLSKYKRGIIRRTVSLFGNIGFRLVSGINIEDSQCGFKMFSSNASKLCFENLRLKGWSFDMEILTIAKINDISFKSVKLDDWADKPYSTFNENAVKVVYRSIIELGIIFFRRIKGQYVLDTSKK